MDLTQNQWAEQLRSDENAVILDVRTSEEFEQGYIPQALNIDIFKGQGFIYEIDALDRNKNYYVYCKAGGRSAQACSIMNEMGFENAYNLSGGITQWKGEITQPND